MTNNNDLPIFFMDIYITSQVENIITEDIAVTYLKLKAMEGTGMMLLQRCGSCRLGTIGT